MPDPVISRNNNATSLPGCLKSARAPIPGPKGAAEPWLGELLFVSQGEEALPGRCPLGASGVRPMGLISRNLSFKYSEGVTPYSPGLPRFAATQGMRAGDSFTQNGLRQK